MKIRTSVPVALSLVVAAGGLAPALAGHKTPKPITESYAVTGMPVPAPLAAGVDGDNSCDNPALEGISTTTKTIKVSGPGTLQVDLTGFAGDWDITVFDGSGKALGTGAGTTTGDPSSLGTANKEKAVIKTKKTGALVIAVCNYAGGPSANATYTFTYK